MKGMMNILGKVLKSVAIIVVGSVIRISQGQGQGVFEKAIQEAVAEVAQRYIRSVNS